LGTNPHEPREGCAEIRYGNREDVDCYRHPPPSPLQASIPSRTINGSIARAATGSAHHQPSTAFSPRPSRVVAESHAHTIVPCASARSARPPRLAATRRFARAKEGITFNETH